MPQTIDLEALCPCCSGFTYGRCCGPLIAGESPAITAEALMRSRYTAHAIANHTPEAVDYIIATWAPEQRETLNHTDIAQWAQESDWLGLTVTHCHLGGADDKQGLVEFIARYRQLGQEHSHREQSLFRREQGRWYFVDRKEESTEKHTRNDPLRGNDNNKVGRNQPCPCGSGKKFKRCCGA